MNNNETHIIYHVIHININKKSQLDWDFLVVDRRRIELRTPLVKGVILPLNYRPISPPGNIISQKYKTKNSLTGIFADKWINQ